MSTNKDTALIYLTSAALGFATQVSYAARVDGVEVYAGSRDFLATTALAYAAAVGKPDAAERAELDALRRFRDGVVALRAELANGQTSDGEGISISGSRQHAVETIDALLAISYPRIGAAP